jgi:hypothetical protein
VAPGSSDDSFDYPTDPTDPTMANFKASQEVLTSAPLLTEIFKNLLNGDNGREHLRHASRVCSFWHEVAQTVLLDDGAVHSRSAPQKLDEDSSDDSTMTVSTEPLSIDDVENLSDKDLLYLYQRKPEIFLRVFGGTGSGHQQGEDAWMDEDDCIIVPAGY